MTDFIIKKPPYNLTSNPGLALVGRCMKRLGVSDRVDQEFPVGIGGIANSDILKSYLVGPAKFTFQELAPRAPRGNPMRPGAI